MNLRDNNIERMANGTFDVLIVGGGINGAVAATALAARGAKVALVDKGDFAGFTSQNSSNLVWGGIKYMETYEFLLGATTLHVTQPSSPFLPFVHPGDPIFYQSGKRIPFFTIFALLRSLALLGNW